MTTTDTDALTERLYQEAFEDRYPGYSWESALEYVKEAHRAKYAAVLLPIIAVEVRRAKAEAWDEGQHDLYLYYQSEGLAGSEGHNPYRATEEPR